MSIIHWSKRVTNFTTKKIATTITDHNQTWPQIALMVPGWPTLLSTCSLLKEAEPLSMDSNRENSEIGTNKGSTGFPGGGSGGGGASGGGAAGQCDSTTLEERQLLGRYGVWLLVGLCTPNQDTSIEILGRLLSMLFHWFHVTAYSFDGTEKSLMHLIFSVGNLTLRIFIHLMK